MRVGLAAIAGLALLAANPALATDCAPRPLPAAASAGFLSSPPLSPDLPSVAYGLGAPTGVFAQPTGQGQDADRVLARLQAQSCAPVATAAPAAASGDRAYVPRTKWDNTPYRYSAGGNGKKFTAADFDAWMAAKGIHIATGKPQAAAPATTAPATSAAPASGADPGSPQR